MAISVRDDTCCLVQEAEIQGLVFAACAVANTSALTPLLEYGRQAGVDCGLNRLYSMHRGSSMFGERDHHTSGRVTPLFAALLNLCEEDDRRCEAVVACTTALLQHGASPYVRATCSEVRFPVNIVSLKVDARGLLRICRMFQADAERATAVEEVIDAFEMRCDLLALVRDARNKDDGGTDIEGQWPQAPSPS